MMCLKLLLYFTHITGSLCVVIMSFDELLGTEKGRSDQQTTHLDRTEVRYKVNKYPSSVSVHYVLAV